MSTMPYGQTYKKNEEEKLEIEFIIGLIMQNNELS
jgi:hypothetical protein